MANKPLKKYKKNGDDKAENKKEDNMEQERKPNYESTISTVTDATYGGVNSENAIVEEIQKKKIITMKKFICDDKFKR